MLTNTPLRCSSTSIDRISFRKENRTYNTTLVPQWYLEHGLLVICIYTIVEHIPNAAFSSFITQIAQCRLEEDRDNDKALIAETSKLIGNSSYGRIIANREKHHDVIYVDESKICTEIIDHHFYDMTELPDGYYKGEKTKKRINLNPPIHIRVFILNYAKLRMLEFFYDLLGYYLPHEDFEIIEMDTDCNCLRITAENVEDLIKPKLKRTVKTRKA